MQGGHAASAAHSDDNRDLLGLGDATSSQKARHIEDVGQVNTQNHNRNVSGSSSIYFDATDSGEPSFTVSDESLIQTQRESGAEEGGAKLKGKETGSTKLEEPRESFGAEGSSVSQSSVEVPVAEEVRPRIGIDPSVTYPTTRKETPKPRAAAGEFHPNESVVPDVVAIANPIIDFSGDSMGGAFTRMPASSVPSFGAQGNTEEDQRVCERIQTIAGPSTSRFNYIAGGPAASPDSVAQSPSTSAQRRKSRSGDNASGLDGTESGAAAANSGHLRPPPYEGYSSGASVSRESLTSRRADQPSREVVVPRWQPDAEVTFCPICATQFSKYSAKTCH